jgi:hypothetical protein
MAELLTLQELENEIDRVMWDDDYQTAYKVDLLGQYMTMVHELQEKYDNCKRLYGVFGAIEW